MSIIKTLHSLLKQALPDIHAARLNALMAAVEAGLTGASVSITERKGTDLFFNALAKIFLGRKNKSVPFSGPLFSTL